MTGPVAEETLRAYAPNPAVYEALGVPDWLDELDLRPAEPHVKMGTRSVALTDIFRHDACREEELALRGRLLNEQHHVVFAAEDSNAVNLASDEVLAMVESWLAAEGLPPTPTQGHQLERAGRAVQEDLCVMIRRDGQWHLDAAVLCFPSLWSLVEKVGLPMGAVHEFVPHYGADVGARVDTFFDRMRPGTAVWRRNFSVKPYPLLFLPVAKAEQPLGEGRLTPDGAPYWLRTERQTLVRLRSCEAILFTIKLQMAPARVLLHRPDIARRLAAMYRSWDAAMMEYKSGTFSLDDRFLPWLESLSA